MMPTDLRKLLLYGPHTEETYRKLPPEAGSLWFSQPTKDRIESNRRGMLFRTGLIAVGTIYLYFFHRDIGEAKILPWIIALYEAAFYQARKEISERDYWDARERYSEKVDKLIQELHPGYVPESES